MKSTLKNVGRGILFGLLISQIISRGTIPARAGYDPGDYIESPGVGKIVYASKRDGNWEIYVMRADGTGKARLTKSRENDTQPCLSPDGRKLLWVVGGEGDDGESDEGEDAAGGVGYGGRIWIMNLDGSHKQCLSPDDTTEDNPRFSFDGKKIVFDSGEIASEDVWIVNADGSGRKRLTTDESDDVSPGLSPNGRKIVFESSRRGSYGIFIMDADGKNQKELGINESWAGMPQFSPDGKTVAYSASGPNEENSIFLMNADGRNRRKLSSGKWDERFSSFSPDGKRLVFCSKRNGNPDIYSMDLNGKNLRRLTTDAAYETQPDWK